MQVSNPGYFLEWQQEECPDLTGGTVHTCLCSYDADLRASNVETIFSKYIHSQCPSELDPR